MSCSKSEPLTLTAGQRCELPLTFLNPRDETPVDLTGATVYLMAKRALTAPDAEARLFVAQDDHADAEAGKTTLLIDLSDATDEEFATGSLLAASIWLRDSVGNRIPYGNFQIRIEPSAMRWQNVPDDQDSEE